MSGVKGSDLFIIPYPRGLVFMVVHNPSRPTYNSLSVVS